MSTTARINAVGPREGIEILATEIDRIKGSIGLPVDDQIELLRLELLATELGISVASLSNHLTRASVPVITFAGTDFIRKTVWLEFLIRREAGGETNADGPKTRREPSATKTPG
jgi:hypothetical protein